MNNKKNYSKILIFVIFIMIMSIEFTLTAQSINDKLLNKKISIDAEDASVSSIISNMAKLSDCNIVLATEKVEDDEDKAESKKITIHLKDVPIEQALSLVVKTIGLSYRLVGEKTFLVGAKERIETEVGKRSYVVKLNNTAVEKIVDALAILPGEVVPIDGQNALMIRANPATFSEIQNRIKEIDVAQRQIEIQARLIEVSVNKAEKYGIDWSKLNKLTTILAEDPVRADGFGLPFDYSDVTSDTPHGQLNNELGELPENQYFQKITGLDNIGHFSRQLTAFDLTIDWLLENNAAKLLTDTRITAKSGEEGQIHIGEIVPFVVEDDENQVQVEREEVGIKLKVKPTVNSDNLITTKIEPEVSSVTELVGGYVPRTKVRKITSTITVPDGKRIIVGGLLNTVISKKTNKVPFLGDIPFIGKLFQHREETLDKTDLIIEITPKIVSDKKYDEKYDIDPRLEEKLIKEKDEMEGEDVNE